LSYLQVYAPQGAPACWGSKYQDGDPECGQCKFNDTCRKEVMRQVTSQPIRMPPPAPVPNPMLPPAMPSRITMPSQPFVSPYRAQVPAPPQIPPPAYHPAPPPGYQPHQQTQYMLPLSTPNPVAAWQRPGTPGPAYFFNQYEGESTPQRLGKNLLLRAMKSLFEELSMFFGHWTWPPSKQ
jgi:hypothetical protein